MKAHIQFKYIYQTKDVEDISLKFENPIATQCANELIDVPSLISQAERYQQEGKYVIITLPYESASAFDSSFKTKELKNMNYGEIFVFSKPCLNFKEEKINLHKANTLETVEWKETETPFELKHAIEKIHDEIFSGNTYQVNYTTRLVANHIEQAYEYYKYLTYQSNGNYNAYIEKEDESIISISPELFFQRGALGNSEEYIVTKPMKGTIERGITKEEDQIKYQQLKNSKKDKAENVMIVDLLRNDLSKISQTGSVKVSELFTIEKYKTVFQMTSTIQSKPLKDVQLRDILNALFPCGSITGAPKESTMSIINHLEKEQRGIYCGTVGILLPDGRQIFNVPIRTIQNLKKQAIYGVGAGITIDSIPNNEIREFEMKSNILKISSPTLIETMRLENQTIKRRDYHKARLKNSAHQLNISFNEKEWDNKINEIEKNCGLGVYKVRMELKNDTPMHFNTEILNKKKNWTAKLKQESNIPSIFKKFKTASRRHFKHNHETDIVLYYNDKEEITEFDIGNIVVKDGNQYFTPKYNEGFLNGCMRQSLLDEGKITEKVITKETLIKDIKNKKIVIFMINSLREWTQVDLKI